MNCVICKVELVEEKREVLLETTIFGNMPNMGNKMKSTGYSICPSCGLVYKEKE